MSNPTQPHILIVGAGITGLLTAHGLQQAGLSCTVFESEPEDAFRPREWTMGVHWGVLLMKKLLPEHLADQLVEEATVDRTLDYGCAPCNGSAIYDGKTGLVLKELSTEGTLLRVSRRKLRGLVRRGVKIEFSHTLQSIVYSPDNTSITALFANGTSHTGALLLGTDGPRSTVRSLLFPPPAVSQAQALEGIIHLTSTFSYPDAALALHARSAHPVWSMMIHPDLFTYLCIQDVPDPNKPETWVFFLFLAWLGEREAVGDEAAARGMVMRKAEELAEPFRGAILGLPEDARLSFVDVGRWVAERGNYRGGRVALAGDAAHPMPPYRGQGLNHAIQDAYNFVEVVKKFRDGEVDQAPAVQAYSDEVAKRGAEETILSTKNAYMLLSYEDFKESPYMKHGLSRQG